MDDDLIDDFVAECKQLGAQLHGIVKQLQANKDQPEKFAEFSNIVDRIYGTAATFGFSTFAEYCLVLKNICAKCAKTRNERAQTKVLRLIEDSIGLLVALIKSVKDEAELEKLRHTLKIEKNKVEKMEQDVFAFINETK